MVEEIKITDEQIKEIMSSFSKFMDNLSNFYTGIGNIEESNPSFTEFYKRALDIEVIEKTLKSMPEDMAKQFSSLLLDFVLLSSSKKIENLSPEEKKEIGTKLKKMSEEFSTLANKFKKGD